MKFIIFFLCLWVIFALLDADPDMDPGTPLNPDPIRIRIRFHSTTWKMSINRREVDFHSPLWLIVSVIRYKDSIWSVSCVRYSMLRRRSGARWRPWTARGAPWERWPSGIISTSAAASMASPGSSPPSSKKDRNPRLRMPLSLTKNKWSFFPKLLFRFNTCNRIRNNASMYPY